MLAGAIRGQIWFLSLSSCSVEFVAGTSKPEFESFSRNLDLLGLLCEVYSMKSKKAGLTSCLRLDDFWPMLMNVGVAWFQL